MSPYRKGDQTVRVRGGVVRLRLTTAALVEIAEKLETGSPSALGARLRRATIQDWNIVFAALANPRPDTALSKVELTDLMPCISAVIAEGLTS